MHFCILKVLERGGNRGPWPASVILIGLDWIGLNGNCNLVVFSRYCILKFAIDVCSLLIVYHVTFVVEEEENAQVEEKAPKDASKVFFTIKIFVLLFVFVKRIRGLSIAWTPASLTQQLESSIGQ